LKNLELVIISGRDKKTLNEWFKKHTLYAGILTMGFPFAKKDKHGKTLEHLKN